MKKLTLRKLKSRLEYNPESGVFKWKISPAYNVNEGDIAGGVTGWGYIHIKIDNQAYKAHRLAWMYTHGEFPKGSLDHINLCRTDNRISNLRVASASINMRNQSLNKHCKTGIMGVRLDKATQKWKVAIYVVKEIHLGYFTDFFEACCVRKSAEYKHGYHPNHGRVT